MLIHQILRHRNSMNYTVRFSPYPKALSFNGLLYETTLRSHRTRLAALPNVVRWVGSKALWVLLLLSILTSCSFSACDKTTDLSPYGCDVCGDRLLFASCINKNFPIGSNLSNLESYLLKIGFVKHDRIEKEFYFRWSSNDLWNVVVVVRGKYKEDTEIAELVIHLLYIPKKRKH